jgi:hypothetical protein
MRYTLPALAIMAIACVATPAAAHVVQATTSVSLSDVDVDDKPQLEQALRSAVDEVLTDAIAFHPTLVALTDAQVIGERLYLRLLIADEDGERTLQELQHAAPDQTPDGAAPGSPGPGHRPVGAAEHETRL